MFTRNNVHLCALLRVASVNKTMEILQGVGLLGSNFDSRYVKDVRLGSQKCVMGGEQLANMELYRPSGGFLVLMFRTTGFKFCEVDNMSGRLLRPVQNI